MSVIECTEQDTLRITIDKTVVLTVPVDEVVRLVLEDSKKVDGWRRDSAQPSGR